MTVLPTVEELRTSTRTIYFGDDVVGRGDAGSRFGRSLTLPGASPLPAPWASLRTESRTIKVREGYYCSGWMSPTATTPIRRYADTPIRRHDSAPGLFGGHRGFLAGNHAIGGSIARRSRSRAALVPAMGFKHRLDPLDHHRCACLGHTRMTVPALGKPPEVAR